MTRLEELLANGVRSAEVAPHACLLALDLLRVRVRLTWLGLGAGHPG